MPCPCTALLLPLWAHLHLALPALTRGTSAAGEGQGQGMLCNWKRILIHTSFFSAKMVWVYLVNKSRNEGNCVHVIFFSVLCERSDSVPECKLLTGKPCNDIVLGVCGLFLFSCQVTGLFATLWTVVLHAPLTLGFLRQEYWNGLPFPFPGDLPDPGIEIASPVWQVDSLPLSHLGGL